MFYPTIDLMLPTTRIRRRPGNASASSAASSNRKIHHQLAPSAVLLNVRRFSVTFVERKATHSMTVQRRAKCPRLSGTSTVPLPLHRKLSRQLTTMMLPRREPMMRTMIMIQLKPTNPLLAAIAGVDTPTPTVAAVEVEEEAWLVFSSVDFKATIQIQLTYQARNCPASKGRNHFLICEMNGCLTQEPPFQVHPATPTWLPMFDSASTPLK